MVAPDPDTVAAPPAASPPSWRSRLLGWLGSARKPLVALAAVGTVLSGLVGYWTTWRAVQGGADATPAISAKIGAQNSIAVLPFSNLSDDKSNEYFADGVTDELIELLSRVRGLHVVPRRSSFYFKGKAVPAADAARQLGAAYLVDGSVRRADGRVRIGAQLVAAHDGKVIWARTIDREFKDVLLAQSEIALGIARSLMPSLDPAFGLSASGTKNPQAWQAYLEARRLPDDQRESAYRRVLVMDPKFARVHTSLAEDVLGRVPHKLLPAPAHEQMTKHLQEALRIDPSDDHAWGLMGAAAQLIDDVAALREVARRAGEANRDSASASGWQAEIELLDGDISAALPLFRHTADRLPLVNFARYHYIQALRLANRPAQALAEAEQALALDQESHWALDEKVRSLLALGRRDEAMALAREKDLHTILIRFGSPGDRAALQQHKGLSTHAATWLQFVAGRPDDVVEHLQAEHFAIQQRSRVLFDPEYDPLRELPSFKSWLARHRLTEAHERAQNWRAANPVPRI